MTHTDTPYVMFQQTFADDQTSTTVLARFATYAGAVVFGLALHDAADRNDDGTWTFDMNGVTFHTWITSDPWETGNY